MWHRHLVTGEDDTVPEVEDILDRGTLADWQDLARKVVHQPHGRAARSLAKVLAHNEWYGTSVIWRRFMARHGLPASYSSSPAPVVFKDEGE